MVVNKKFPKHWLNPLQDVDIATKKYVDNVIEKERQLRLKKGTLPIDYVKFQEHGTPPHGIRIIKLVEELVGKQQEYFERKIYAEWLKQIPVPKLILNDAKWQAFQLARVEDEAYFAKFGVGLKTVKKEPEPEKHIKGDALKLLEWYYDEPDVTIP